MWLLIFKGPPLPYVWIHSDVHTGTYERLNSPKYTFLIYGNINPTHVLSDHRDGKKYLARLSFVQNQAAVGADFAIEYAHIFFANFQC